MNELMKSPRGRATILIGIANLLWLVLAWEFLVEISEDKPFLLAWRATAVVAPTVLIAIQAFVLSMRPISVWWLVGASCAGVTTLAAPISTRDTQDALMVLSIAPLVGLGYWLSIFQRASLWGGPGGRRYPGKLGSFGRLVQAVKEDAMRLRGRRLSDETAAVADALDAALAAKLSFAAVALSGFRRRKEFLAANGFLRLERDFRLQLGVAAKALNEALRELGLEGELEIANRYDDADQELKRMMAAIHHAIDHMSAGYEAPMDEVYKEIGFVFAGNNSASREAAVGPIFRRAVNSAEAVVSLYLAA